MQTPTPWKVEKGEYPHEGYLTITARHAGMTPRSPLALLSKVGGTDEPNEDAALIVRAVNSYAAMKEALEVAKVCIAQQAKRLGCESCGELMTIHKALALAAGKE